MARVCRNEDHRRLGLQAQQTRGSACVPPSPNVRGDYAEGLGRYATGSLYATGERKRSTAGSLVGDDKRADNQTIKRRLRITQVIGKLTAATG